MGGPPDSVYVEGGRASLACLRRDSPPESLMIRAIVRPNEEDLMSTVLARIAPTGIYLLHGVPAGRRPELIGRGAAAGYTGAYREPGTVDIEEVVAVLLARGPE